MIIALTDELISSIHSKYGENITHINLSNNGNSSSILISCLTRFIDFIAGLRDISLIGQLSLFLEKLNLSNNQIDDIEALSTLTVLKKLNLADNQM